MSQVNHWTLSYLILTLTLILSWFVNQWYHRRHLYYLSYVSNSVSLFVWWVNSFPRRKFGPSLIEDKEGISVECPYRWPFLDKYKFEYDDWISKLLALKLSSPVHVYLCYTNLTLTLTLTLTLCSYLRIVELTFPSHSPLLHPMKFTCEPSYFTYYSNCIMTQAPDSTRHPFVLSKNQLPWHLFHNWP